MFSGGINLGKLFGISIKIDWSWFFIFLLVTWQLAVGVFPSLQPEWNTIIHWLMAILASLMFFGSVLAHELAHSLMAKVRGLPVRRITLFLFGGVSNLEREPASPLTEFLVTIVGPITSFVLGGLFLYISSTLAGDIAIEGLSATQFLAGLGPFASLFLWLGSINILLAVFNLVPGFPLDGGRVLRSILWAVTGNLKRSTRLASMVGQGIAWVFIIAGIAMAFGFAIPPFQPSLIGGLWLAFIGWFLNMAAAQSYQQVVIRDLLEGVNVERLMRREPPIVSPYTEINHLVDDFIMRTDEHAFPVVDEDRLVGIICLDDVRKVPRSEWEHKQVGDVMTPYERLEFVGPREDAMEAFQRIQSRDIRQLPVIDRGELVGLLRRRDILKWLELQQ
ncbi:MAG: site-2 protease family protein [Anaerolineales bacterium]|nr:site-2 protease family protein [Anaerolineales bacterium]